MRHIPSYETFKESLNENAFVLPMVAGTAKLNQAADVITSFLNKKTKKAFKKYPFMVYSRGEQGIMLYSAKDSSAVRISSKGASRGPGIVGDLAYFSDATKHKSDFVMSSDNFPIVSLLNEFAKLINEPAYAKEVEGITESVNETKGSPLSSQEKQMVMKLLTKKLETNNEWICYLQDESGHNVKAVLGKSLSAATAKMLDTICFEMVGPATQQIKFVS